MDYDHIAQFEANQAKFAQFFYKEMLKRNVKVTFVSYSDIYSGYATVDETRVPFTIISKTIIEFEEELKNLVDVDEFELTVEITHDWFPKGLTLTYSKNVDKPIVCFRSII